MIIGKNKTENLMVLDLCVWFFIFIFFLFVSLHNFSVLRKLNPAAQDIMWFMVWIGYLLVKQGYDHLLLGTSS